MKFCKNLQQIIDIADPEWAPYWTNYKMLKKLIKELPSLVPSDDVTDSTIAIKNAAAHVQSVNNFNNNNNNNNVRNNHFNNNSTHSGTNTNISSRKNNGNNDNDSNDNNNDRSDSPLSVTSTQSTISSTSLITNPSATSSTHDTNKQQPFHSREGNRAAPEPVHVSVPVPVPVRVPVPAKTKTNINRISIGKSIGTSPGEIAFFKLLRSELNKASRFFDRANQELSIREERVRDGIDILNHPGSTMVNDKWSSMAKAIYRLYKDLLLLELYAIMTYTSFSKILKKHDKNTGYQTRIKFMTNVVNKANFTHYPDLLGMIRRCEAKYEQVDTILVREGKSSSALDEDERLFISMIHRFYGQIMDKAQQEGVDVLSEQRKGALGRRQSIMSGSSPPKPEHQQQQQHQHQQALQQQQPQHQPPELSLTSSLKSLVEENDAATKKSPASSICLSDDPDDGSNCNTGTGTRTSAGKCIGTSISSTNCTTGLKRPAENSMKDDMMTKKVVKKCKK